MSIMKATKSRRPKTRKVRTGDGLPVSSSKLQILWARVVQRAKVFKEDQFHVAVLLQKKEDGSFPRPQLVGGAFDIKRVIRDARVGIQQIRIEAGLKASNNLVISEIWQENSSTGLAGYQLCRKGRNRSEVLAECRIHTVTADLGDVPLAVLSALLE